MITFEISVNGKPLYRTGVGEFGMLTAHIMWARGRQNSGQIYETLWAHATSIAGEDVDLHSEWPLIELKTGDEIRIRIVDGDQFDPPSISGTLDSLRPNDEE